MTGLWLGATNMGIHTESEGGRHSQPGIPPRSSYAIHVCNALTTTTAVPPIGNKRWPSVHHLHTHISDISFQVTALWSSPIHALVAKIKSWTHTKQSCRTTAVYIYMYMFIAVSTDKYIQLLILGRCVVVSDLSPLGL